MGKLTTSISNGQQCMNELHPMESLQLLLSVISKIDKIHLNENNTIYRAEGNANLVLSMPDIKRVVRLRKSFVDDILNKGKHFANNFIYICMPHC
jgi:citrate synthase